VINRQGEAHLQVYQGNSNWKDVHITDSDLDPYYMTKEERENGPAMEQEVAPSAPPPTQQQHSAYAPPTLDVRNCFQQGFIRSLFPSGSKFTYGKLSE
jgi:hypothetical protein